MGNIKHGEWPFNREEYGKLLQVAEKANSVNQQLIEQLDLALEFITEKEIIDEFNQWRLIKRINMN